MATNYLKQGLNLMLSPGANTKKSMSIGEVYNFYYRATIWPLIIYIILSFVFAGSIGWALTLKSVTAPLLGLGLFSAIAIPIFIVWIFVPVMAFIGAAVFHVVGSWLGFFKRDFDETITAMVYSRLPMGIFAFVLATPFSSPLFVILALWAFIISIIALANLQKVSWSGVLGVMIVSVIIVAVVVTFVASIFAVSLSGSVAAWAMNHTMWSMV